MMAKKKDDQLLTVILYRNLDIGPGHKGAQKGAKFTRKELTNNPHERMRSWKRRVHNT